MAARKISGMPGDVPSAADLIPYVDVANGRNEHTTLSDLAASIRPFEVIEVKDLDGLNSVTFSAIPDTYDHLEIRIVCQLTATQTSNRNLSIRLNGDSGANYDWHLGTINGATTVGESESYGATSITVGSSVNDSFPTNTTIEIPLYAETSFDKVIQSTHSTKTAEASLGMLRSLGHGQWRNTAAVTSLTLTMLTASDTWAPGSKAVMLGKV